ncbi:MAG: EamA family transporter RarD, partial [Desulfuromonadales bacterium]
SLILGFSGRWNVISEAFRDRRVVVLLITSALLIATNWLVFIIAIAHSQVIQSSLGYFITPFISVLLGVFFLKERLSRLQIISLFLAAAGVILLTVHYGRFPWVSLILAVTFGSYGLFRKIVTVDSITGLTVETLLLSPFALGYLIYVTLNGTGSFPEQAMQTNILLVLAGVATSVPLLLFASAARRLRLATIGFLQYITPTMHFLLAVMLYKEPFTQAHLTCFVLIWAGLCCYSYDAVRRIRAARQNVY